MQITQSTQIIKIVQTTKGSMISPLVNPQSQIKLIMFNQMLSPIPSLLVAHKQVTLDTLQYHLCHPHSLQNTSLSWSSIQHQLREVITCNKMSQNNLLVFDSSAYEEKLPEIFEQYHVVKGYNYQVKIGEKQLTQQYMALIKQEHVFKQIKMEFALGNGKYKPGYIGQITFQYLANPRFQGILYAYLQYSAQTACPIVINYLSPNQQCYYQIYDTNPNYLKDRLKQKISIIQKFLNLAKQVCKHIVIYNLPILLVQNKQDLSLVDYFKQAKQRLIKEYDVNLGFHILRYIRQSQKQGINEIIKLSRQFSHNIILSSGLKYKTNLQSFSGHGLSLHNPQTPSYKILNMSVISYLSFLLSPFQRRDILQLNVLKLMNWKEKKEEMKIQVFWKCQNCGKEVSEKIKAFNKHGKMFCSIKCLKQFKV